MTSIQLLYYDILSYSHNQISNAERIFNLVINKKTNYGNKYSYSGSLSYSNQFNPWWRFSGTVLTGYVISKGEYGNDIAIDNRTGLLSLSTNQTFTFSKKFEQKIDEIL